MAKVYVLGYRTRDEEWGVILRPLENIDVAYSKAPEWKLSHAELADLERMSLEKMNVHVGEHYCKFSVEDLNDGEFAIVCLSHPELAAKSAGDIGGRLE